jgi:RNA polymerase sigma-70 factor (ECF subfamily)
MATDREIFLGLVGEHGANVLALLRRLCGGRANDAEDLFQEVAVRVWRNLGSRPILRNPRGWLMTIAYRVFLDHQARLPVLAPLADDDALPARAGRDQDPAELTELREQRGIVADAVAELSPATRSVVSLHYTGGLSIREIASALGISVGTVKSRLNSGLEQLRRRLS